MFAILDIGKTNKKTIILDSELKIVAQKKISLDEYEAGGLRLEQPEEVFNWFIESLAEFAKDYIIESIAVTTQGASLVCLDAEDRITLPPLAYTNDGGEEFDQEFFARFGAKEELQQETLTASIGSMINCAKLIYFLQQRFGEKFGDVAQILFYPQFFVNRLCGAKVAEPTYLGCHTYLYDARNNGYSRIATELGIRELLPEKIVSPWEQVGRIKPELAERTGISPECIITAGIHDSNSSLLPYIITSEDDFILNSTGTWCVLMHRSKVAELQDSELGKTIFYNFDAFASPVKTAVFMGGREYAVYSKIIEGVHGRKGMPDLSVELYQNVLTARDFFFIPSVEVGVGILPDSKPGVYAGGQFYSLSCLEEPGVAKEVFADYERSFAALNCSLAAQSKIAIDYAGAAVDTQMFVEGGFRKNSAYCQLLAELYPQARIFTTNLEEATAIGAGIIAKAAYENTDPYIAKSLINIEKTRINPLGLQDTALYVQRFVELAT